MLYITNSFSINMLAEPPPSLKLDIRKVSDADAARIVQAAMVDGGVCTSIGSDVLADAFMMTMLDYDATPPEPERVRMRASRDDCFLWLIYVGPKIQHHRISAEGRIDYYLVRQQ